MNIRNRLFCIITAVCIFLSFSGCKSMVREKFVYSIKRSSIQSSVLELEIKNLSDDKITCVSFYAELIPGDDFGEEPKEIEFTRSISIDSGETVTVTVPLSDFKSILETDEELSDSFSYEDVYHIKRLYASIIEYENKPAWKDLNGTWCF